ncbi:GNAT family N-acetyltransferase [Streptomyces sp. DSM 44915]|uniref:GNAT family N-acetyltransferase n=1 Tax=Streptomyces chisholmiae TaxID=3075540 RepID=A0ABU2JSG6_9ACTN|nr:GNAT family N-acetyltransferase [Streptomyces sp. DSM 44915]MDT0267658.1 GNAT family N-acetyltransferase [Streptomyces sp. DSM 44915]
MLEYTFFEQGFVTVLMVAPNARRRGVGAHLLRAVEEACTTPKLFTSTNVSNHLMQHLLQNAGWHAVGLPRPGRRRSRTLSSSAQALDCAASSGQKVKKQAEGGHAICGPCGQVDSGRFRADCGRASPGAGECNDC